MTDVDLDEVESAIRDHSDPVVTAGELAEPLGCSSRHVLDLLRLLEREKAVKSKQTGARAVAWWHVDRVRPPPSPERTTKEPRENDERNMREPDSTEDPTDEIAQAVDAAAANWDDSEDRIDARKAAARAVLSALRDRPLSKSEIIEEIYPEYPVDGQSENTWWRKNIAECHPAPIKELAEYNPGTQKWEM